jgi:hypothetical protein
VTSSGPASDKVGPRFYLEDVLLNVAVETPAMTMTEAHVALYSGLTHEPAEPGLVPDTLLICVATGLGWRVVHAPLAVRAFLGFEWTILAPVRVGDTIHSRSRIVTKRVMREGGVVIDQREIINQRGEVVQHGRFTFLVDRRPAAVEAPA